MVIAILLLIYGVISIVGVGIGAAAICSAGLIVSGAALLAGMSWGAWLGFAMTLLLVIFGRRYSKAQVVMPTGMMLGVSVVVVAVLFTELFE